MDRICAASRTPTSSSEGLHCVVPIQGFPQAVVTVANALNAKGFGACPLRHLFQRFGGQRKQDSHSRQPGQE
jgi:hypothetical protein